MFQSTQPAATPIRARTTEIDITGASRALGILRFSDYLLCIGCGSVLISCLPQIVDAASTGDWGNLCSLIIAAVVLVICVVVGWRCVGVIDPRAWTASLWALPLLLALGCLDLATVAHFIGASSDLISIASLSINGLWYVAVALPCVFVVSLLCHMKLGLWGIPLQQLLRNLSAFGSKYAPNLPIFRRKGFGLAIIHFLVGGILMLTILAPYPDDPEKVGGFAHGMYSIQVLGFCLLLRGRRYLQIDADSLLAVDKRAPILFLRSFSDDPRQNWGSEKAFLDFSLETRLANHFDRFGPFVAVASSKDKLPLLGASRAVLSGDQWQSRVLGWIGQAHLILMYCGTSQWINWELERVVAFGRVGSLILLMPEVAVFRSRVNAAKRMQLLLVAFHSTEWAQALSELRDVHRIRALLFLPGGRLFAVKSKTRNRDSYHLAALIAHYEILSGSQAFQDAFPRMFQTRNYRLARQLIAACLLGAAVTYAGLVTNGVWDGRNQVKFYPGAVSYAKPVTEFQARQVGLYLFDRKIMTHKTGGYTRVDFQQGRFQLRFIIDAPESRASLIETIYGAAGSDISRSVLGGAPVDVLLCDSHWKVKARLSVIMREPFGQGNLYYAAPVDSATATKVAAAFRKANFGTASPWKVRLRVEAGLDTVQFMIDPTQKDDPEIIKYFESLGKFVSAQVFDGKPLSIQLCNSDFRALRTEEVRAN